MTPTPAAAPLRFGRFELQPHERRLLVDGRAATLGGRAFDLLLVLAERAGSLVDKGTLLDLVWPGLVVHENNLAAQMSTLRKLLGEGVIATIPGRGYRFVARLEAASDSAAHAPAPPAAGAPPRPPPLRTNLPAELPPIVGREAELSALAALIDGQRLVSVVGAGGIGKSLLTQHALAARRGAYAHGVCWIELAALADPAALPGAVAAALGVHGRQGDPLDSLVSAVSSLTMLMALDNAEHLLDAVAALARALLDAAPGLRIVATSQAPLRLAGEQLLRVEPLAVPEAASGPAGETALTADEALHFGAVALFAERARAVDRRFGVTDANVALVVQICHALDGLPLAIELAAARAPLLGLPRLLEGMQHRLALLTQGRNREAPPRQRTLRAALEWSHELLAPREQRAFRRLGVVAGSASLELVLALLADDEAPAAEERWEALDALDLLVERSLVALAGDEAGGAPRYRMLETPRAYALDRLTRCGERAALQGRHARAVAALFDAAYADYFGGRVGADDWLRRLEHDLDNARDALRWAREAGDAALQLRIGSTMLRALPPSLHVERVALADACEACIHPSLPEPLQLQAWIELSCVLADPQKARARRAAERALVLARRLDAGGRDRFVLYHALARACSAAAQTEDLALARALLAELQPLEDPAWPAQRLLWGAEAAQWVARMGGEADAALRIGRRLLALDRERGGHASIATGNLIDAELAAGNVADAARLGEQLEASLRGTRHEYSLAFTRINLLAALLAIGDVGRALPVARAAWAMAAAFELQHAAAAYLALLSALQGRDAAAVTLAAYSEAIYAARGEVREQNETAATLRATKLAGARLGDAEFERCRAAGAELRDGEVEALAFG